MVLVNSGAGLQAHPHWSAYAASKHGLRALADSLRAEEQEHGVRVTSVYPGRTATPMQDKVHEQEGKAYDAADWIDPATVADAIVRRARPAGRRDGHRPDAASDSWEAALGRARPAGSRTKTRTRRPEIRCEVLRVAAVDLARPREDLPPTPASAGRPGDDVDGAVLVA